MYCEILEEHARRSINRISILVFEILLADYY